jgi:beta-glucanase (GH16 family)
MFIDIRAKMPPGKGFWPGLWMMPKKGARWPKGGEVDIMEGINSFDRTVHSTLHFGDKNTVCGGKYKIPAGVPDTAEDFHTYSLLWDNSASQPFRFFFDGHEITTDCSTWNPGKNMKFPQPFTDNEFYLILMLGVGGSWPKDPSPDTIFPQTMLVDYARVYQKGGEPTPYRGKPFPSVSQPRTPVRETKPRRESRRERRRRERREAREQRQRREERALQNAVVDEAAPILNN